MHAPHPDSNPPRKRDEDETGVRTPPVPPDQAPDVIPQRDPPKPGIDREPPPKIVG